MDKQTFDDVIIRLDRLEKEVVEINQQLSSVVNIIEQNDNENSNVIKEINSSNIIDNNKDIDTVKSIFAEIYRKMGISPDFELRPIEELHDSMRQSGIRAEDNEFSQAIIKERNK